MTTKERNSSGIAVEKYDLTGKKKKYASVYCYESKLETPLPANVKDTNLIIKTLRKLGFIMGSETDPSDNTMDVEIDGNEDSPSSDDDGDNIENAMMIDEPPLKHNQLVIQNQLPKDLFTDMRKYVNARDDACCFIMYFIVHQKGYKIFTAAGMELPLFQLWKYFKNIECPIMFLVQPNITDSADVCTVLFNSDEVVKGDDNTLPMSANKLLAYLPNCGNGEKSVAEILSEELDVSTECKPFDINTNLTNVIERLNSQHCWPSPKFSSTLHKQLYLTDGREDQMIQEPSMYNCTKNLLAYAFLFGHFKTAEDNDMLYASRHDAEHLKILEDYGFKLENCFPGGKILAKDFKEKLSKILEDEALNSCECFMLIMSTHGDEGGKLYTYNSNLSLEYIWRELSRCKKLKGKPIVLLIDACRGRDNEVPATPTNTVTGEGEASKDASIPEEGQGGKFKEPATHTDTVTGKQETTEGSSNSRNANATENAGNATPKDKDQTHMRDMLIAMGTIEGKMSYCQCETGSFFIKEFCEQIKTQGGGNILTILNSTMHNLGKKTFEMENEEAKNYFDVKQQATFTSTLQKQLNLTKKK